MGSRRAFSVVIVHDGDTRRSDDDVSDLTSNGTSDMMDRI
jgi:hypothetical protein